MRISASIYSDKKRSLEEVIKDLEAHKVDLLHVDCNDDPRVFEDIRQIRNWTDIPVDLHIITSNAQKYFPLLKENPVEYVTFQLENLEGALEIPSDISGKKGIAIVTPTPVEAFDQYANFDFILLMATVPGQSGGVFDPVNFKKIRDFQKKYPNKSVHVDGGVNGEVSFILRNMGVSSSVSGSFLFNAPSIGHALMELTKRESTSQFVVRDFMIPLEESPVLKIKDLSFHQALHGIETGAAGFVVVTDDNDRLEGIVTNADARKALLKYGPGVFDQHPQAYMNTSPVVLNENFTVNEMLRLIRSYSFPISYLPVVDDYGRATGIITFVNLIKGEI